MSNRNWIRYAALGVITVALIVWGFSAWRHYHEENTQKREYAAQHDTSTTHEPIQTRCRSAGSGFICEADQPYSEGADEHTKADLKAQQDAAEWSFLSMLFTGSGVIVTIIGLVFVVQTLNETRIANTQTRELFIAENRPWLKATLSVESQIIFAIGGDFHVNIRITTENVGNGQAFNVKIFKFEDYTMDGDHVIFFLQEAIKRRSREDKTPTITLFKGETTSRLVTYVVGNVEENLIEYTTRVLTGWIEYEFVPGG